MEGVVGLTDWAASARLEYDGPNEPTEATRMETIKRHVVPLFRNPLILLLAGLGLIAYCSGDHDTGFVIWLMMLLAVGMQLFQEFRGEQAAAKLKEALNTKCRALRGADGLTLVTIEARDIVTGDIVSISAGDLVPADGMVMQAKKLRVNQSRLTGESVPVVKKECPGLVHSPGKSDSLDPGQPNVVLMGSMVVGGNGLVKVIHTGDDTEIGKVVGTLNEGQPVTRFDKDMQTFTWMMIRFIFVMAPLVLFLQAMRQGFTLDAFMYAVSVSVGLAPEMLPMIFTACLVYGALDLMKREKCIVKRVNGMQSLGTMDTLCTDKTGTLTEDNLSAHLSVDMHGIDRPEFGQVVLGLAKLNSAFQTGIHNFVEEAVQRTEFQGGVSLQVSHLVLVSEEVFDSETRYSSVTLESKGGPPDMTWFDEVMETSGLLGAGTPLTIIKGAVAEVGALCSGYGLFQENTRLRIIHDKGHVQNNETLRTLEESGERILGVAVGVSGEYILIGYLTFTDPPKPSAQAAVASMRQLGVSVRMLTGDTKSVASTVADKVGISNPYHVLEGSKISQMSSYELQNAIKSCYVFARLTPSDKQQLVKEFKSLGKVVGFVGDGVNDVAAIQEADVGISVDTACDAARSAADVLLTRKSLTILSPAVNSGRRVFLNMIKYIKMAASSNFGNMFSVLGASLCIPFIPMLPIQVVTSNVLYDIAQLGIPSDSVDNTALRRPLELNTSYLFRFIVVLGFVSSLFDYLTFAILYFALGGDTNQSVFHTGWFVEGLLSQTLVVFVLRDPSLFLKPVLGSKVSGNVPRPSWMLISLSVGVCVTGMGLTIVPSMRTAFSFATLPGSYWLVLPLVLIAYLIVTSVVMTVAAPDKKLLYRPISTKLSIV
mmetsp:Transcript_45057/g.71979  ORF Transcript_45057/g.71979 Transcript_45057/m.71979 type:complete len:881 (+) Transcript_45057:178-2820(+)|eukprot:CAMPEP_0203757080 /NCGR_PEP_ID=MMETSP0098-20131031/10238_1 /ASSEMBLY_ACC=CAM_ASM_000208 /TAXON_ID=96639 /ORGANISM=" , Strain NY0313808BC1" /LENGTH=880 /DNA_ID=CAMNT_0050649199 /DNA_START=166 /DNA_END=2808 /DNA_ORIENTATION=+